MPAINNVPETPKVAGMARSYRRMTCCSGKDFHINNRTRDNLQLPQQAALIYCENSGQSPSRSAGGRGSGRKSLHFAGNLFAGRDEKWASAMVLMAEILQISNARDVIFLSGRT
jgi:hypothetical protein